jgi:hypothetical protein
MNNFLHITIYRFPISLDEGNHINRGVSTVEHDPPYCDAAQGIQTNVVHLPSELHAADKGK